MTLAAMMCERPRDQGESLRFMMAAEPALGQSW